MVVKTAESNLVGCQPSDQSFEIHSVKYVVSVSMWSVQTSRMNSIAASNSQTVSTVKERASVGFLGNEIRKRLGRLVRPVNRLIQTISTQRIKTNG